MTKLIPPKKYFDILSRIPVVCVDNIVFCMKNASPQILLVRRTQPPALGCLYPLGKGISKNRFTNDWAPEVVSREAGLNGKPLKMFGIYEVIYDVGQNKRVLNGLHNICLAYLTEVRDTKIKLTSEHSDFQWVTKEDFNCGLELPPYTRTLISDSKIFSYRRSLAGLDRIAHRFLDFRGTDFSKFTKR